MGTRQLTGTRPLLALCLLVLLCSGCVRASTSAEVSIGANEDTPTIEALSLAVVAGESGAATLVGTLLNEGTATDKLTSVEVRTERGDASASLPNGPVVLRTSDPVRLARESAVRLESKNFVPGFLVDVTLTFDVSQPIRMKVPVEPPSDAYAEVEVGTEPDGDITPGEITTG